MRSLSEELRLGCQLAVPPEAAAARGLFYEAGVDLPAQGIAPVCAPRVRSAHAPFMLDFAGRRTRVNIAALDRAWRDASMRAVEEYFAAAARYDSIRLVVMHTAPRVWCDDGDGSAPRIVSDYALLVESLRRLADIARCFSLSLAVENNRAYWDGDVARFPRGADPHGREYFGTSPEEWLAIRRDVARDNLHLCLDTSHATTYAQCFEPAERQRVMRLFLAEPPAICHIHWNDNDLLHPSGRQDLHLPLGRGTIGDDLHSAISALPGVTRLLEHFYGMETLDDELAYISRLRPPAARS